MEFAITIFTLESLPLAPWGSLRRHDLLEVLDRINPTIAELTQAIENEAEKCCQARRLMTHSGVGALTAVAFVLNSDRNRNEDAVAIKTNQCSEGAHHHWQSKPDQVFHRFS